MKSLRILALSVLALLVAAPAFAQNPLPAGATLVQPSTPQYALTAITATAAVNTATTLDGFRRLLPVCTITSARWPTTSRTTRRARWSRMS